MKIRAVEKKWIKLFGGLIASLSIRENERDVVDKLFCASDETITRL